MQPVECAYFPVDEFSCFARGKQLVVTPINGRQISLIDWAKGNQAKIAAAIKEWGAVVFRGFDLTFEQFKPALEAVTAGSLRFYKGDSPRGKLAEKIYKSTAVADAHLIPLHQEEVGCPHDNLPKYIAFFCDTPPAPGTGRTLVGDARAITKKIQASMPQFWKELQKKKLTYTSRFLPEDHWRTKWIRWLNPSHPTIKARFGTEDKQSVEEKCRLEGLECMWDGGWAVVTRKGVPATVERDGETLFANQIHLDRFNHRVTGGWINYFFACLLLYPTERFRQYDVCFDGGAKIKRSDAAQLLDIIQQGAGGIDWEKGDMMVLDNIASMHGKTPHYGPRNIAVALA